MERKGRLLFLSKVRFFVERSLPVHFVLPAFPFKSANVHNKVLGTLPDKGEELTLTTLRDFCDAVKLVYPPGCCMVIVSDGHVFPT